MEFKEDKRLLTTQGINICAEQAVPLTLAEEKEFIKSLTAAQVHRLVGSMSAGPTVNGQVTTNFDCLKDWRIRR